MSEGTGILRDVPLDLLVPRADNPRTIRDEGKMVELAESVRKMGVLEPALVRPHPTQRDHYELLAGTRRLEASRRVDRVTMPVLIRDVDDDTAFHIGVVENLQREDLTPMEAAHALEAWMKRGRTPEQIAEELGRDVGWVVRRRKLLDLSPAWQKAVSDAARSVSQWPVGNLELVARMNPDVQDDLLEIHNYALDKAGRDWRQQGMPTRTDLLKEIGEQLRDLKQAKWNLKDADLVPAAGSCADCLLRTGVQPVLFEDMRLGGKKPGDFCLKPSCWASKVGAYVLRRYQALKEEHGDELLLMEGGYTESREEDSHSAIAALNKQAEKAGGPQPGVEPTWAVSVVKSGTPGAKPAMIISGVRIGEKVWIKTHARDIDRRPAKGQTKSLAERREALKGKRAAALIGHVVNALWEDPWQKNKERNLPDLVCLAAAFGAEQGYRADKYLNNIGTDLTHDGWKAMDKLTAPGKIGANEAPLAAEALYARIKPLLAETVKYYSTGDAWKNLPQTKRLCELLGLDYDTLWSETCTAIPEPKGWAKLIEEEKQTKAADTKAAKRPRKPKASKKNVSTEPKPEEDDDE